MAGADGTGARAPGAEPAGAGSLLAGRYRLGERLADEPAAAIWQATDEVLARPVTVYLLPPGSPRAGAVVTAARAAARLEDPRLARVFDADETPAQPYVVTEWVPGTRLDRLLQAGPLAPARATAIIAEAARALAAAHAAGLAHLCLAPDSLWLAGSGEVRLSGLGLAAALRGAWADDPARADACGLGQLLYAALTGYWPGAGQTTLPPAPRSGGRPLRPRQLRAGIPAGIDEVTWQAVSAAGGQAAPVPGPAQLAAKLAAVALQGREDRGPDGPGPASPAPTVPLAAVPGPVPGPGPAPARGPVVRPAPPPARPARPRQPPRGRGRARLIAAVVIVLALLAGGGWLLARQVLAPHPGAARPLVPAGITTFDPYGDGQGENRSQAPLAIDGNPATAWHSNWYTTADFGHLKPGTGLLLDMGHPVTVTGARITLGSAPGAAFWLRAGPVPSLARLARVAHMTGASGQVRPRLTAPARGRYLLVWFTRLPPDAAGTYQAVVAGITLTGRAQAAG